MTDSDTYNHDECSYLNRRRAARRAAVEALGEAGMIQELMALRELVSTLEWAILRWSRDHPGLLTTDGEEILGREACKIRERRKA